ncbi:MAG: ABC transporter substrate-binding protein [Methylocella sp.]
MYPDGMKKGNPKTKGSPAISNSARQKRHWRRGSLKASRGVVLAVIFCLTLPMAVANRAAAETLRLGVQKTGTFALELAIIKANGLDAAAGLDIVISELASPEAGKIALIGGSVDLMLTDWLWVARERALGAKYVFAPYSSALGAVMVPAASPIRKLDDLRGKTLAVAGGQLDKSWLLLRALAETANLDLKAQANIVYGAPALLYAKTADGEIDASLNYWNFCVALEARGFRRLIGMDEVERRLGAKGPVAMVGYVFDEKLAQNHAAALASFFKIVRDAKDSLAHSDADWVKIGREINVSDPKELELYRKAYVEGIPRRSIEAEAEDASALYRVLAKIGGPELVGPALTLDPSVFYRGAAPQAPAEN